MFKKLIIGVLVVSAGIKGGKLINQYKTVKEKKREMEVYDAEIVEAEQCLDEIEDPEERAEVEEKIEKFKHVKKQFKDAIDEFEKTYDEALLKYAIRCALSAAAIYMLIKNL